MASREVTKELDKLNEIFLLLDPDPSSLTQEDKAKQESLLEMLSFFTQSSRRISDYYHLKSPIRTQVNFSNVVPRFMHLLRESILSHEWSEALKLVQVLTKEPKGTDSTIWKVGLACLYQDERRSRRLVEQFVKQVYVLRKLAVVEVMLDYLLFLLTQSDLEDAKQLVQELKQNTLFPSQLINDKRKMAHTLFFAYQGLTLYAEWKLAIYKAEQEESERDFISYMLSQGTSGPAPRGIADSALEYLLTIRDKPGVWDIFLTRIVEIYEYYGNVDEARNLLQSYREKNPTNPNAHRYLYEFESNHEGDQAIQIECLKGIMKLDPCNPLCLKLYNQIESAQPAAVELLFDFLDYDHCRENDEVWDALAAKLEEINNNFQLKRVVTNCWETRKDWWPSVMFQSLQYVDIGPRQMEKRKHVHQALLALEDNPCIPQRRKREWSKSSPESGVQAKRQKR